MVLRELLTLEEAIRQYSHNSRATVDVIRAYQGRAFEAG
jgi:hypothetical protein